VVPRSIPKIFAIVYQSFPSETHIGLFGSRRPSRQTIPSFLWVVSLVLCAA
jgi:hypothetical protein